MTTSGLREEVFNVKLADLLNKRGIISAPESILLVKQGRRLPDVLIGDYWGVRLCIEGKFDESTANVKQLTKQCKCRIEDGIASIAIGVLYPPDLRNIPYDVLPQSLENAKLKIKIFTETGELSPQKLHWYTDSGKIDDWIESDVDGLSEILGRAYENLVEEDVVNSSVNELGTSIETAQEKFSNFPGISDKLSSILVVPYGEEDDDDEEN